MNVKIAEDAITFKVTESEMKTLLSGNALQSCVQIGPDRFVIGIDPISVGQGSSVLLPVLQERSLVLKTTLETVQALSALGKNKEGISMSTDGLKATLQLDIRRKI